MTRVLLALVLSTTPAFADPPRPGSGYPPVTAADVPRLKLNHYFTPDRTGQPANFTWTFTKDGFTLKKDKAAIPADLLTKLLPDGATAEEITGKWKLVDGSIVFTDIQAAGKPGRANATYHIYRTAPTVVRIGEPQYVFSLERK